MSILSITSGMPGILDPLVSGQCRRQAQASTVAQMQAGPQSEDVAALQQAFQQLSAFAPDSTGSIASGNTKPEILAGGKDQPTSSAAPSVGNPLHQGPLPPTYGHYLGGPPVKLPLATATSQAQYLPSKPDLQLIWSNAVAADASNQFDLQA